MKKVIPNNTMNLPSSLNIEMRILINGPNDLDTSRAKIDLVHWRANRIAMIA